MHSIQGAFLIKDISYELYFIFICPLVRMVRSPLSGARNLLLRPLVISSGSLAARDSSLPKESSEVLSSAPFF